MKDKLILGTVQFGLEYGINNTAGKPSRQEVFSILEVAADLGIKSLDTADQYGNAAALIGEFNRSYPQKFLVNTKFKIGSEIDIKKQVGNSLDALNIPEIGVYFYHRFADLIKYPEVKPELVSLKASGRVRNIGISIYTNEELEIAAGIPEIDVIQIPFNVLDNISQRGASIRKAKQTGKLIQARSVFLQGLLFKKPDEYPPYLFPLRKYTEAFHDLAKKTGMTIENICLSYALCQPEIDQVIIGVDSKEQLIRNLAYSSSTLTNSQLAEIDAINVKETDLLSPVNWK